MKNLFILLFTLSLLQSYIAKLDFDNWSQTATGPWGGREGLMGVSMGDHIYMAGGRGFFGLGFYNDVWRSKDGSNWELVIDKAPWSPRGYHVMVSLNNCMFIMGGQNFKHFYNDVWKSCDEGKNWDEVTAQAPWVVRAGLAALVYKNEIYLTGGSFQTTVFSQRSFYNDVWKSSDGKNWELLTKAAPWHAVSGPRLVELNDKLFIIGGEDGFSEETQFNLVWSTTDGINWTDMGNADWVKRSGHGVVVYDNTIYVIGGYLHLHDIWASKDGQTWTKLGEKAFGCQEEKCGRFDFWTVVHNDSLVIFGGTGAKTTFGSMINDTWVMPLK